MKYLISIFTSVKHLWRYYTLVIVLGIITAALGLAVPFLMAAVTDTLVSGSGSVTVIIWLAVALLAADVLSTLVSNWAGYLGDVMSARLRETLSNRYYEHLLSLPQNYYDSELTGTIINRLNRTISEVTQFINMFANNFFSMYLTLIVSLVILFVYSWKLALLMTIMYPVFMFITTKTSAKWQKLQKQKNLETDIASGRFAEVVSQIRVVKSFVNERPEFKIFGRRNQKVVKLTRVQSSYWHVMDVARRMVLNILFFASLTYIFLATLDGRFSVGDMVLLTTLLNQMRFPIFNMSFIVDNLQKAIAGSRDYFETMATQPAISDEPGAKNLRITSGNIEYSDVTFGYQDETVLHNISFSIKSGEKVAFVGESGEGKTTLTNLLLRLYDTNQGQITIDNQPIKQVKQNSLRRNIAVVFQDPALFSGTIRENIAYGHPKATTAQIEAAAKAANALDFIQKLEKGLDTEIGERGLKLSGGQKQRIAIARALLKDAPILILDEATSSLDSRSEHQVQEALDRLMKGRTTLIIAHRLSTIAHVDKIITLKNGRIHEIGTPSQLASTGGIYSQLLELQAGHTDVNNKRLARFEIAN